MGASVSKKAVLNGNKFLEEFVSHTHVPANKSEFWDSLLDYDLKISTDSQNLILNSQIETLCQSFASNNNVSGNFNSLVVFFIEKTKELIPLSMDQQSPAHISKVSNALFMIKVIVKNLIETKSEQELLKCFEFSFVINEASINESNTIGKEANQLLRCHSKFEEFIESLSNLLATIPVKETNYILHLQAINVLIVLLSVQIFSHTCENSEIFKAVYAFEKANVLSNVLMHFVISLHHAPNCANENSSSGSFVVGFAESLLSILTFRKSHDMLSLPLSQNVIQQFQERYPLANQSLLLLLILLNHNTVNANSYRNSVFNCIDSQISSDIGSTFKINFTTLYDIFCQIVTIEHATLLLYFMLHRNVNFYKFVISCSNLEYLVVPILKVLYNASDTTSHHIYMTLIILLILSEDDGFNKKLHQINSISRLFKKFNYNIEKEVMNEITTYTQTIQEKLCYKGRKFKLESTLKLIFKTIKKNALSVYFHIAQNIEMLKNVTWYTERTISEISLGGLLILVMIRTIQHNMLMIRDKYLHTNCLAALANMSSQFRYLHPYVAQRLISLLETLSKKHFKLIAKIREQKKETLGVSGIKISEDTLQDINVLEEVLRMLLEIINACLSNQLIHCPNLIYTLLYKKHVFEGLRGHHNFQDVIQNIDMVVGFFSSRLQRVQEQKGELDVNEVFQVISKGATQWSNDRLQKFPDLKFKYVEEPESEEFFIPYVWSLVCKYGLIHFNTDVAV